MPGGSDRRHYCRRRRRRRCGSFAADSIGLLLLCWWWSSGIVITLLVSTLQQVLPNVGYGVDIGSIVSGTTTVPAFFASAMPLQVEIDVRSSECMFEKLNEGESVTMSAFILAGSELMAEIQFDGPLGTVEELSTATALLNVTRMLDAGKFSAAGKAGVKFEDRVDMEHLNTVELSPDDDHMEDDGFESEDGTHETREQRRERIAKKRKRQYERKMEREKLKRDQKRHVLEEGEPYMKTVKAAAAGWYRYCLKASWNAVTAEMELRKESEYGGVDEEDGHVKTYEQMVLEQEERELEADTATEEGIQDEDFDKTRHKLKTLREILQQIHTKQQQERHKLLIHTATNEHSHSRMVLSSLMETIVFMAVTGFQVYTVRKWFKGTTRVLG